MFRQIDAQKLAQDLLNQHGLTNQGWVIQFNKSPSFLGQCWHNHKAIALSTVMLNSAEEAQVKDTILHEIAHALVGPFHAHDDVWKETAQRIGCTSEVCGRSFNPSAARRLEPSQVPSLPKIESISKRCPKCGEHAETRSRLGNLVNLKCGHLVKESDLIGSSFEDWTSLSGKKLYPYQVIGSKFIESSGARCLIADQPALGKTAQALSFAKHHPDIALPVLWITKSKLKVQAAKEFIDWCGLEYFPCTIDSTKSYILEGMKVYIISMDLLRRISTEKLDKIGFKTIVFDEIQHISNPDSQRTQEVKRLCSKIPHVIFLSGTPWKNRGTEYFSALNILRPDLFSSEKNFQERWVEWYESNGKWKAGGIRNIREFREYTKDFIIRRLRDEVLPDLPKIRRSIQYTEVEDIYQDAYEKAEKAFAEKVKDQILEGKQDMGKLQDDIMILKHIVGLSKIEATVEYILEWLENSEPWEKLCVFHHHIDVGDEIEKKLDNYLVRIDLSKCLRLRGGMDGWDSNKIVEKFKNDVKSKILLASTLASGEGLNLQFCQNAIMMERQWNPANEEQAELRFSRPVNKNDLPEYLQSELLDDDGSPKRVSIPVPYIVAANTVDELLTEIIERKRHNFDKSMNPGQESIQWSENDIMRELTELIMKKRYGKVA